MGKPIEQERWLELLRASLRDGSFVKLTLSAPRVGNVTQVLVRPVSLRAGERLSFVFRHPTRDVTKNLAPEEGAELVAGLAGTEFQCAHLFTTGRTAQLEMRDGRRARLILGKPVHAAPPSKGHDRPRETGVDPNRAWLRALGVTTREGRVTRGMEAKFRQINRFIEILRHLSTEAGLEGKRSLTLVDMGCGKGYLTFAAWDLLGRAGDSDVAMRGIEVRPELVELCRGVAAENGCGGLHFEAGTITSTVIGSADIVMALHACDTATDDAIARGIKAGASLILVAPCCHKELRPQLRPPPVLAGAMRHGILLEREAEFVTDALRAALLEWAGYRTKVFEFISTEHTAKNLMIAAVKRARSIHREALAGQARELAAAYGIRTQRLATNLGFSLGPT